MRGIETERLRVVPLTLGTAQAIIEGQQPPDARWADGYPADSTLVAAAMLVTAGDLGPFGAYQAIRKRDETVVAGLGFLEPPDADGVVHLGFSETPAARAEELLPEALAGLASWARDHPDVRAVRADTAPTNDRSIAVLEAAGLRRTGADRQLVYFEL